MKRKVWSGGNCWRAMCPCCRWERAATTLPRAYDFAARHMCFGPAIAPAGAEVVGGASVAVRADDPRPSAGWWGAMRPKEVW